MKIGVLSLQGAFDAHAQVLRAIGHQPVELRDAAALSGIEGLVLPGGESTVQLELLRRYGMLEPLQRLRHLPLLATCAGLILIARGVQPEQGSLGWLDVDVERNAYGTQLDSFETASDDGALELVLIRAPRIVRTGPDVEILARHQGDPVLVRQGKWFGATFHPELTRKTDVHARVFPPA